MKIVQGNSYVKTVTTCICITIVLHLFSYKWIPNHDIDCNANDECVLCFTTPLLPLGSLGLYLLDKWGKEPSEAWYLHLWFLIFVCDIAIKCNIKIVFFKSQWTKHLNCKNMEKYDHNFNLLFLLNFMVTKRNQTYKKCWLHLIISSA